MAIPLLGAFLVNLAVPAVRSILMHFGVGVLSFAALTTAVTFVLNQAKTSWGGLSSDVINILQLAGSSTALSIIAGALITRTSIAAMKKFGFL
jgi:hypothetical protein